MSLLKEIEDKRLLCGHIAAFVGEFDRAQEHFLASTNPRAALDVRDKLNGELAHYSHHGLYSGYQMRKDLLEWERAMTLAVNLSPADVPYICREYANQLEFQGDYLNALQHFEKALSVQDSSLPQVSHV